MKDEDKPKRQLVSELAESRQRIAELEALEAEHKRAEETMHLFKAIVEASSEAIAISDPEGWLVYINPTHEKLFGHSLEARQINYRDYYPPESVEILNRSVAPALARGESWEGELDAFDANGRRFPLWERADSVRDAEGKMLYGFGLMHDVTERKQAEEALRIQCDLGIVLSATSGLTEVLDQLLEATFRIDGIDCGGVYLVDKVTGELNLVSHKGLSPQFLEVASHYDAHSPQARLVMAGEPIHGLYPGVFPTIDETRQPEGLRAAAIIPVKYEKQVVAVLNLASHTHDEIPVSARRMLEAIAAQIGSVIARATAEAALRKAHDELEMRVEARTAELAEANQDLRIEITERKRAEEALKASQEYSRNIIGSSLDMIISVDVDRRIVEFNKAAQEIFGYRPGEVLGKHVDMLYADPREGLRIHETTIEKGQCVREVLDRRKNGEVFPAFLSASVLRDARGELVGVMGVARDITEHKRAEGTLRRRNRELELLNQVSQAFTATLDLDQVLVTVLEEVRRLLDVVACSVWLIDPGTDELVCRQATGPRSEIVRGWRLALDEGIAGWVARSGESLIVPDTRADERHFRGVDQRTGLSLRSILSVPLRVRQDVVGVLQVVDAEVGRFSPTDLTLLEPLAAAAASAIENARLYEQARQDAETRSVLLREVNHRVKNNLTAIISLLYAARRRAGMEDQAVCQSIMQDLANQVHGLSTVHSLLSASGWAPLPLSKLTRQVIRSSLRMLPSGKHISVDVTPSPVRVTADQAHDLALVINELATNTVKHALQERDTAHITVRIALEEDTVLLEFRDDGPGYPEEALQLERHDAGLDLIQNMVRKSLRGELSLRNDHGAVAVIQFEAKTAEKR